MYTSGTEGRGQFPPAEAGRGGCALAGPPVCIWSVTVFGSLASDPGIIFMESQVSGRTEEFHTSLQVVRLHLCVK